MRHLAALTALLAADDARMAALSAVRALALRDGWIGAGFVRDAIWDRLHGRPPMLPGGDVDVLWHDPSRADAVVDRAWERALRGRLPGYDWSVKNQARMHARNGDAPYADVAAAMRAWPETATAVAVRLEADGAIGVNAPLGLDDLFAPVLRPTPHFAAEKRAIFDERVATKRWLVRYPLLRIEASGSIES
ncbi:nucleotidyltransferase family protein [Sphingomonas adhaesiva]|uniref:nucleotidyltransferase family protein n=1 Tax=Sphingomonas adhaesiva TaxID=28212 RepID=UPI002FF8C828